MLIDSHCWNILALEVLFYDEILSYRKAWISGPLCHLPVLMLTIATIVDLFILHLQGKVSM